MMILFFSVYFIALALFCVHSYKTFQLAGRITRHKQRMLSTEPHHRDFQLSLVAETSPNQLKSAEHYEKAIKSSKLMLLLDFVFLSVLLWLVWVRFDVSENVAMIVTAVSILFLGYIVTKQRYKIAVYGFIVDYLK